MYEEDNELLRTTVKDVAYDEAISFIKSKGCRIYGSSYSSCCKELREWGSYLVNGFKKSSEGGEIKVSCSIKKINLKDLILP